MTATHPVELTDDQRADLDVARRLAAAGVPIFLAAPSAYAKVGFALPENWEQTVPDPAVLDAWRPGMAVCAVTGCGLDLLDFDPRNGGDTNAMDVPAPHSYGAAFTPSEGVHSFIASLGVWSRNNVFSGVDVKAGMPDGSGRGFAFIAPTVRPSKVTGEPTAYRWVHLPDLDALAAQGRSDASGAPLAQRIRELRGDSGVAKLGGPDWYREFLLNREPQSAPAAERVINEKLRAVAAWTPADGAGFRDVLLAAAFTLGGYVGGGYLEEDDARDRLAVAVSEVWDAADEDDALWIEQGIADGQAQPFYVYTAADELTYNEATQSTGATAGGEPPWNVYNVVGTEPFDPTGDSSDQALAEQVAVRMFPALRFGVDSGRWLVRAREVWVEREDMAAWAVSQVARLMPLGETPVPKELTDRTEGHWQAVRRARFMDSGGAGKVERKLKAIVRNADHLGLEVAQLDADPEILWAGGLPYDLRASGDEPVCAPIDPATPHLHTAAVAPLRIDTPHWDRFVAAVFPDAELRAWALRVLSVALAGYPDAVLPVLYGPERTGKTSLVQLIIDALGTYAHAADPRLLAGADNAHASVVYALKGRRLSFIDEGPRRGHLASERLKQLTGGAALTGNAMRSNPVTFKPTHTLVMTTNDEPPVTDPALRARMRVIPCEADQGEVRAARRAITAAVWASESPGVLAALMAECAAWLADQDSASTAAAPALVRGAVDEMAAAQSPVREWVEMCTVPADPGTPGRELYRCFLAWFEGQAMYRRANPPTETAFGRTLNEMGFTATKRGTGNDRKSYRPLSVFGGGGGPMGWSPQAPETATKAPPPAGTVVGGSEEGSGGGPAQPNQPRSTPVSSSSWEGWEGMSSTTTDNNTHTTTNGVVGEKVQGNTGRTSNPPSFGENPGPDLRGTASGETRPQPAPMTPGRVAVSDLDEAPKSSRSVTNSEVARRADEAKVSKAEARAQLKEERRLAAVAEAQGEVLELPAVVDRAGHVLPVTVEQAEAVVREALRRSGALTVDVETSGYPLGHRLYELRSVQLGDANAAVVLHPGTHAELVRELLAAASKLHAHSATADLGPLAHAGLIEADSAWERMHDTVIPAKLADPASTGSDPGLKQLAGAVLREHSVAPAAEEGRKAVFKAGRWLEKTEADTPLERSGWAQIATGSTAMLRYAASDVLDTAALAQTLPMPEDTVYERERLAQRMTARIAFRGVPLDYEHIQAMSGPHREARAQHGANVRALGIDNPGSAMQIAKALTAMGVELPKTGSGRDSVTEDVLSKVAADQAHPQAAELAREVLEYRGHDKALGTYLDPYRLLCELGDGRARPTIYTLAADTGRMSSVRPNFQNIPRAGGFRASVTSDPGMVMIGADFSGVELRFAAALSQDPTLLAFLAEGRDLHAEVAKQVWGEGAGKAERYIAKRVVFGRLYGGGIPTLAKQAGVSESIAQSAVDVLDDLTPGLAAWSEQIKSAVKAGHTQFRSYSGRVIHLPMEYPHKAPNYCVGMNTPVLRSDLTHVPASEIRVGDRLVGFDEFPQPAELGGQNRYHHLRTAVVEAVSKVVKPSVKVHAADGKVTECSTDHLWLVRPLKGRKNNRPRVRWVRADALQPGDDLLSLGTWDVTDGRTAGYVAGLYDGEGSLTRHAGGRRKNQLFFSQNRGLVMDAMRAGMDELGLPYSYYDRSPNSTATTDSVVVSGLRNVMRTLGSLQPARFRPRFEELYEGNAVTAGLTESVQVTAIEPAGELELASIQTSTRTLVANGYLSHNCIQGSAREVLIDALVKWRDTRWGDATLLPVHDELDVWVPEQDAEEATRALVECMETEIYGVRIVADPSAPSKYWQDST